MPENEQLKPLGEVARSLPVPLNKNTVLRWPRHGVRTVNGGRVRLQARQIGGRWYCTQKDFADFLDATGRM